MMVASTLTTRAFFWAKQLGHAFQDFNAADAANRFVGVRKMLTNVARANRAEQGVGNRVRKHVGVGMTD